MEKGNNEAGKRNEALRETVLRICGSAVQKCMRCGKCSGTCPAYDEMEYHPHQFVAMVERGEIEALMASESMYQCLTCFACVDRCPRGVEPAKVIEAVRLVAERRQNGSHMTAAAIPGKIEADADLPQQAIVSALRKYSK